MAAAPREWAVPMARWLEAVYSRADFAQAWWRDGFECVQQAGELVYVPPLLRHATFNEVETLAVARTEPYQTSGRPA